MNYTRAITVIAAASVCIAGQIGVAAACNYDGAAGATAKYPRAIEVATALRDRSNAPILDTRLVAPTFANMLGYHRAIRRLQRLRESLERAVHERGLTGPGFSLLLVEAGLWSRYVPDGEGVSIAVHTAGPQPADAVVFTGEAVIEAIGSTAIEFVVDADPHDIVRDAGIEGGRDRGLGRARSQSIDPKSMCRYSILPVQLPMR